MSTRGESVLWINVAVLLCLPSSVFPFRPQRSAVGDLETEDANSSPAALSKTNCELRHLPFAPQEPAVRTNLFQQSSPAKSSCALVSNSGMLRGSGLGQEIDSHDSVWRLNMAPTKGYEKDVGTKTDVRLLNDHGTQWIQEGYFPFDRNVTYLFDVMLKTDRFDSDLSKLVQKHPDGRFGVIPLDTTEAFNKLMRDEFKLKRAIASTGAIATLAALHTCDSVNLYHMAHTANATKQSYHYWEKGDGYRVAEGFHGGFLEQDALYKQMAINDLAEFEKTGKLAIAGFTKSNCTSHTNTIVNGGSSSKSQSFLNSHSQSFLNVTEDSGTSEEQRAIMRELLKFEIGAMERLARDI